MAQEEHGREMPHNIILEGREKLTVSGVTDVQSFDEEQILLETQQYSVVPNEQQFCTETIKSSRDRHKQ